MSDTPNHVTPKSAIDENDDLFSFDELTEPKIAPLDVAPLPKGSGGASAQRDPNEEAMAAVLGPAPGTAVTAPTATKADAAPVQTAATSTAGAGANDATKPGSTLEPASGGARRSLGDLRASPLLLVGLAVFALANLGLIGLTWKSMATLQQSLGARAAAGPSHADEPSSRDGASHAGGHVDEFETHIPAQLEARPEGEETLESAHAAIERGDYERARQLLWGLLAVADRWPPERRDDLEARATLLIAEAFRRQADARDEHGTADTQTASPDEHAAHAPESAEEHR
ncbi:MAG: hypothetical protein L6Q99_05975 [Planctomycetes bacterium]|nr:hypothetical protein [Planctomycetota bacterium]